jgi:DNA mismatch endonuclease (patch repair protein)
MADIFTKEKRSEIMSLIRSTNTKPELALRKLVSANVYPHGYRYKIHYKKLPGRPDIVFVGRKIAIFMDGTFWHGHTIAKIQTRPTDDFWRKKIENNMARDKRVNYRLKKLGWKIIRIWEHDLKKSPQKVLTRIMRALEQVQ